MKNFIPKAFIESGEVQIIKNGKCYSFPRTGTESRHSYFAKVAQQLAEGDYEISSDLEEEISEAKAHQKAEQAAKNTHLTRCFERAREANNPVVISTSSFQTTAGCGTNYDMAMPDGSKLFIQSCINSGSPDDKVQWSAAATPQVKKAIALYWETVEAAWS